ncbi:related to chloride channel protein [Ustilago trichophora]|uniref:Chloride channel protein n=1 Tax=Ustilago trichophora TaxID=86804 RepID=A0A5C3EH19_9BASI|nr:related to chloride channel protein [Ustilago trichophora]
MADHNHQVHSSSNSGIQPRSQTNHSDNDTESHNPGLSISTRPNPHNHLPEHADRHNVYRSAPSTARPRLAGRRTMSAKSEVRRLSSLFVPPNAEQPDNAGPSPSSSRLGFLTKAIPSALSASASISSLTEPLSPIRSFYGGLTGQRAPGSRKRRKQHLRSYDDAKFEDEMNLPGSGGNGIRVWYESYTTIDWIHDAIKESSRLRRIRNLKGIRGLAVNSWDRLQGWIIVTITGVITALIAGCIVKSEAVLFDLKDGYCARDWRLAKRFCCPYGGAPDWDHPSLATVAASSWSYRTPFMPNVAPASSSPADAVHSMLSGIGKGNRILSGWAAPVAGSPTWNKIAASSFNAANTTLLSMLSPIDSETDDCPGWITWGHKFGSDKTKNWFAGYAMYFVVAVIWASIASILTIYLTSSELYLKDKVSASSTPAIINSKRSDDQQDRDRHVDEPDETTALLDHQQNAQASRSESAPAPTQRADRIASRNFARLANEQRAEKAILPRKVLYFATGSGISEVKCILSGFVIHGYLGFWTLFTKSVGLTLSVASGLSLGKEGPFVHIASCVGNIVCRAFPKYENNEGKRREMLSCACAAGVAVAFGAPVGGVLFSLEEVSYYFPSKVMFRSFFCAMVAAATLRAIDPFGTGKIVLFQVTYDKDWHFYEMLFFVLIGIFGGLYGAYFTKLNMFWAKNVRAKTWMARHPIIEVVFITVVTAAFSFFNGYTRMGGVELIADLFSECHEHESLEGLCVSQPSQIGPLVLAILFAMVLKGLLTIITFGIKLPAGIFIPTLAVGACFGRIVGLLVQYVQWTHPDAGFFGWCPASDSACIVPGVYAMVGAAAALSGVTRTTVSLAVIMFELTGTLTYSVPVMLSILVAKTIADALEHKGIYDLVIDFSGLPYLDSKTEYIWNGVNVTDAMETEVEVICLDAINTVQSLGEKLDRLARGSGYTDGGFPIVSRVASSTPIPSESPLLSSSIGSLADLVPQVPSDTASYKMVGYIAASELEHALTRAVCSDPDMNPDNTRCSFKNLPFVRAEHEGEAGVRDSVLFTASDPLDLSRYVDKAPITVQIHSPLELVHQYFTRLGVRYLIVVDERGLYRGVIFKKSYLKFLADLEAESEH